MKATCFIFPHVAIHAVIGSLDPKRFKEFQLVKRVKLSYNVAKFTFALPTPTSVLGLPIGQHIICRFFFSILLCLIYFPCDSVQFVFVLSLSVCCPKHIEESFQTGARIAKVKRLSKHIHLLLWILILDVLN